MRNDTTESRELLTLDEPVAAHLTLDPAWSRLIVVRFGSAWDIAPDEQFEGFAGDERLGYMFREIGGPVIGFMLHDPHEFDPEAFDHAEIWERPRFNVPVLGVHDACVGEIVLAVQGQFGEEEATMDASTFHWAIAAEQDGDLELAASFWHASIEAGDMKARFGLGYTLVELGRFREAYDHLRIYTEINPHNAWAWHWLGMACEGLGDVDEAVTVYRRAIKLEAVGGVETQAGERLRALGAGGR